MKPPPFRYTRPTALAEALDLLARAREAQQVRRGRRLMPPLNPPEPARPRKRRPSLHDRRVAALKGWSTRWSRRAEHHAGMLEKDPGPPRGPAAGASGHGSPAGKRPRG